MNVSIRELVLQADAAMSGLGHAPSTRMQYRGPGPSSSRSAPNGPWQPSRMRSWLPICRSSPGSTATAR